MLGRKREMCKRVERICQVDPEGWYAPVIGQELIRCKDCKYRKQYTHADWSIMLCDRIKTTMADGVKDEDFCSRAERKEE